MHRYTRVTDTKDKQLDERESWMTDADTDRGDTNGLYIADKTDKHMHNDFHVGANKKSVFIPVVATSCSQSSARLADKTNLPVQREKNYKNSVDVCKKSKVYLYFAIFPQAHALPVTNI